MVNSLGFYVYNENKERILNPNLNDPYFKNSGNDSNVWTKWTGYILPLYMSDSNSNSQADSQFDETNGVDWKWPRFAKYVALRIGSCGSDSENSETVIVRRSVELDSFEPPLGSTVVDPAKSVDSLLHSIANAASTDRTTIVPPTASSTEPAVGKTWYLNLSFREFETPLRPGHVGAWTFNISDFREWESKPNNTGKGYVNGKTTMAQAFMLSDT